MRIVFCGGGTGGHLFTGIAMADNPGGVHFLCTPRRFDAEHLSACGLPFTPLRKYQVRAAVRVLKSLRPDVVIGLGGGGSLPGIMGAVLRGIPFVCLEQNVLPGRLNRIAAGGARRFYCQWRESKKYLPGMNGRFRWTGSPLRRMPRRDPREARLRYGLSPDRPTVLVLGGSQGALALDRMIPAAAAEMPEEVQFLHLTPREDVRYAHGAVRPFEHEMEWAYSAADAAVSRAGGLAIAELCRFRIPALLIPYPHARDDHQAFNARAVARAGGARLVREENFTPAVLAEWVRTLVSAPAIMNNMRRSLKALDRPKAEAEIRQDLGANILS